MDVYNELKTLPMTATPTAPPTCLVVSFTADPTPALARGKDPMIDSVAGAMVNASPHAVITMRHTMSAYDESPCVPVRRSRPTVVSVIPAATTYFVPKRSTRRFEFGATIIIGIAKASNRTPVWSES